MKFFYEGFKIYNFLLGFAVESSTLASRIEAQMTLLSNERKEANSPYLRMLKLLAARKQLTCAVPGAHTLTQAHISLFKKKRQNFYHR